MTAKRCYYETLGVSRDADSDSIKSAFRKLAMRWHPDRNPGNPEAEERFKECSEAFSVLADGQKRGLYDRFGHAGLNGGGVSPFAGGFEDIFAHFGDILGDMFGRGGREGGPQQRRGCDLKVELELDLEEAFSGVTRDVTFHRHDLCESCRGSGAREGTRPDGCGPCHGTGRIKRQQGFFMVQTVCPVCRGQGTIIKDRCGDCGGDGFQRVQRTLSVKFPAGIGDGNRLRVQGEGDAGGASGQRGDLAIHVRVRQHPVFQRDGADVYLSREIAFSQAVLGADLEVPTLHGPQLASIPAGTQTGTVLRLRNRGMPRLDGVGHGDQYVTLNVAIPSTLSPAQAELLEQLRGVGL